ncbi:c-type cytochrome [Gluconacetobacter tumulicola]|uniref:C-type cytochrome n=1 Tax=Gluconacetobacter tumulicola TaxID=1017177 RepID=A0A7W4JB06_9PROT|nr:c-type cytochrome [Gluconacetobacter tumulicola]
MTGGRNRARRAACAALLLIGAGASPARATGQATTPDQGAVARGAYLAAAGDCVACHTAPGGRPFAGGRAIRTAFGTLLGSNITPDTATGIGGWTDAQFLRAVKRGIGGRGQRLYAAMPFNTYARASDRDILDIKAYLASQPPVRNAVATNQLRFPFNIRLLSAFVWSLLYFDPAPFRADPTRDAQWNRGAYLVTGLGHCTTCHSPKNRLGADDVRAYLGGAPLEGLFAPALDDAARTGLGGWTEEDIVAYLHTGTSRRAVAAGPMAEIVSRSTQFLTDADLRAIAVYLRSVPTPPGQEATPPAPPATAAMEAGARLYGESCRACHGADGQGIPGMVPALAGHARVQSADPASALNVILQGAQSAITHGNDRGTSMPAFAWKLTDAQVADVTTFLRNSWGNRASPVTPADAARARQALNAPQSLLR